MFGFVYIWYDIKHKRYYIGSHLGKLDDGYICSSKWMIRAYRKRPKDFKRKILEYVFSNRNDLLNREQYWLNLIKEEELGKKYYNLKNVANGGFSPSASQKSYNLRRGTHLSEVTKLKQSKALIGKPWTEKRRKSHTGKYSRRLIYYHNNTKIGTIDQAVKYSGRCARTIDRWCQKQKEWSKQYVNRLAA